MKRLCLVTAASLFLSAHCLADNWAHWRGPTGNGAATDATPPTEWSPTKNIKWKVKIPGKGSGSPVVWEDKVFVVTSVPSLGGPRGAAINRSQKTLVVQRPGGRRFGRGGGEALQTLDFVVLCFHRKDGKLLWQKTATSAKPHQATHSTNNFAPASPCTDGKHVYAHFGSRGLFCYTMDGDLKWSRTDFEPMNTRNSFGEGSSPTLAGDKIIVPWDHEGQSYLYALNKLDGENDLEDTARRTYRMVDTIDRRY